MSADMSETGAASPAAIPFAENLRKTGGETGRLIADHDWSRTSIGSIDAWPQSLRTALTLLLASPVPIVMLWNDDGIMLYNDAYSVFAGGRHPQLLGSKVREGWPEVADFNDNVMKVGLAGKTLAYRDQELTLHRYGRPEQVWMNLDYSPVQDESGRPAGVVAIVVETTQRVLGERARREADIRRDALIRLTDDIRGLDTPDDIAFAAARVLGEIFDVSRAGYGLIDPVAETITIARDWNAPGITTLAGVLHFRDYGSYIEDLKQGRTVVFADAEIDPRTRDTADALKAISAQSVVNMPVSEQGAMVALLYLNHATAREWSPEDLALIKEVAQRTRTATERARVTVELRELNDRLEEKVAIQLQERDRLWSLSQDPFLIADTAGTWLRASPAWTDILGWTEDELVGRTSEWMEHPDDRDRTRHEIDDLAHGSTSFRFVNRFRDREGAYHTFSWTAVEENGLLYCVARDITIDQEREQELNDSQDFARLALGAIGGVGVWTFDVASDRFFFDEGIARVYALNPEDGAGGLKRADFLANVHPDDKDALRATMAGGLVSAGGIELEYRIVHPDGSVRWVLSRGNTYFDETGQPVRRTGVGVDMTDKRRLEEQLRQSQKMEAVGQLTGGIAHDFNNMLAVVMGSLDLLNRRIGGEEVRAKHYVAQALEGAKRAANLTQRLLAFSRQQPLRPETINVNRLVSGMSDLLVHSLGGAIQLETVLAAGVWGIHADPNQLENVLLNLGVNARDAMPDGGRLTIETQNAHLDARYVASEMGVTTGQYVMIAVSDTGSGMSPEIIARAFDPFFTTKEVGKGTGLGLSQVYGFVKQSGGHIKIYSEIGQGTTIKVYLPRLAGGDATDPQWDGPAEILPGDLREVVLVVDDEPAVRQFSTDALEELGYRVLEADSAVAALALLDAHPDVSLLFTDIVMPETNGKKLADMVRTRRPDIRVLFTTGYTRNAVVHNGIVDAGVELIGKPFTIDELAARVREVLDR